MRLHARHRYAAAAGASVRMHSGDFPGQVPRRYSRGCTRRRSWCFQHPYTRVYEHTGASVRGNAPSYFLTIASRSPREARTYSLVHHDTRDTGRSALHRMWGLSGMNFLLILQLIFFVGKNSVAGSLLVFECEATDIHE